MPRAVVFLHGGPGGSTSLANTVFFNPEIYRVVLFDQRGAGKSTPKGEIRENTTHHLVEDIEKLRAHLGIQHWHMVFGGSWGSTLGLFYAQSYPERVKSLVLRGVSVGSRGASAATRNDPDAAKFYPEMYARFVGFLPEAERHDAVAAYYERLISQDPDVASAAAREWNRWGLALGSLTPGPNVYSRLDDADWCLVHARMEAHYLSHGNWLEAGHLLSPANIEKMKHIPGASG
jgi:proline iminopeptidase